MDMEEIAEEMKQEPKRRFDLKEKGVQQRMVKAVVGKKLYQCLRCIERSISGKVLGVCYGLGWIEANKNSDKDGTHRWQDKLHGRASSAASCRCGQSENVNRVL